MTETLRHEPLCVCPSGVSPLLSTSLLCSLAMRNGTGVSRGVSRVASLFTHRDHSRPASSPFRFKRRTGQETGEGGTIDSLRRQQDGCTAATPPRQYRIGRKSCSPLASRCVYIRWNVPSRQPISKIGCFPTSFSSPLIVRGWPGPQEVLPVFPNPAFSWRFTVDACGARRVQNIRSSGESNHPRPSTFIHNEEEWRVCD